MLFLCVSNYRLQNLPIKHLDLHGNQIKRVECLEGTRYLQHLDLSDNSIQSLRGLQGHPCLEKLLLRNNSVLDTTEIKYLMDLRGLRELNFDSNPIQTIAGYRANIVFKLTQISLLDGEAVTPKEKVRTFNYLQLRNFRLFLIANHHAVKSYN